MQTTTILESGYRIEIDHDKLEVRYGADYTQQLSESAAKIVFEDTASGPLFVRTTAFWGIPGAIKRILETANIYVPKHL